MSNVYSNEDDLSTTPEFVIKQTTVNNNHNNANQRAKHAYETLQRLEKEKDDLFEL